MRSIELIGGVDVGRQNQLSGSVRVIFGIVASCFCFVRETQFGLLFCVLASRECPSHHH
jgi:hypothetical protein